MKKVPNPGSKKAIEQGCSCAVMDNHYGKGFPYGGETCFYINGNCPVHVQKNFEEAKNRALEKHSEALKKLATAHKCEGPCAFGGEGCIKE
jgi:hypothetical protein